MNLAWQVYQLVTRQESVNADGAVARRLQLKLCNDLLTHVFVQGVLHLFLFIGFADGASDLRKVATVVHMRASLISEAHRSNFNRRHETIDELLIMNGE